MPKRTRRSLGDAPLVRLDDGAIQVPLTRGKVAVVDSADAGSVSGLLWCAQPIGNSWYAVTRLPSDGRLIRMHRAVMGAGFGDLRKVDHIDGDGLNNRRSNLRWADKSSNGCNRGPAANNKSGFKGVSFDRRRGQWIAQIHRGDSTFHLGSFDDPVAAARAYDRGAREHHGEFAWVNFPEDEARG